jgi:restriction system protein
MARGRRKLTGPESGCLVLLAAVYGLLVYAVSHPGIVGGVGLLGFGLWWWASEGKRRRFRALRLADVDSMGGREFEHYVAALLEHQGYSATVTKGSGDLGVDVIAVKGALRYAVQTKRYSAAVPRTAVSDAVAGMAHYKCNAAMVVTTHRFSDGARQLALANGCVLVDRNELAQWIVAFQDGNPGSVPSSSGPGLPLNISPGLVVALVGAIVLAVVSMLGQRGDTPQRWSPAVPSGGVQPPPSPTVQYRDAILSMNPTLTSTSAERLANSVLTSSAQNAVDARLVMAVVFVESKFEIGKDPEAQIALKASRLRHALVGANPKGGTTSERLQAAVIQYGAVTSHAAGRNAYTKAATRRRKAFARKVVRLYYQMCGKTPPDERQLFFP